MTGTTAQAGAINLLEKYTTLNRSMDDARSENARIQSEKESILQQMEKLAQQRESMQAETIQAREETATLNTNVQEALVEYSKLEDRHAKAVLEKTEAQRQLEFAKQSVQEERLVFLGESRDFRITCKRMRLSALAVGDDMATRKAFLERHDVDCSSDDSDYPLEDNAQLEQALDEHARCKEARDQAKRALEDAQARERVSSQQAASRLERKNRSIAQLERLRAANAECENQLKDLDEQTKEARELAHHYEQDVNRRLSNTRQLGRPDPFSAPSVTPASAPRFQQQSRPLNPYASSSRTTRTTSSSNRTPRDTTASRRSSWDSNEAQPHLMTRRRPFDRQFGSNALDIISGRERDEQEEETLSLSDAEPTGERMVYKTIQNPSLLDSDSDDDDDELFGDAIFAKKK